jgi:hypothetical protein
MTLIARTQNMNDVELIARVPSEFKAQLCSHVFGALRPLGIHLEPRPLTMNQSGINLIFRRQECSQLIRGSADPMPPPKVFVIISVIPDPRLGTEYCNISIKQLRAAQKIVPSTIALVEGLENERNEKTISPSGMNPPTFISKSTA